MDMVSDRRRRGPDLALLADPDFGPALDSALGRGGRQGLRAYAWAIGTLGRGGRAAAVAVLARYKREQRPPLAVLELPGYQVRASLMPWAVAERAELWEWFRRRDRGWRPAWAWRPPGWFSEPRGVWRPSRYRGVVVPAGKLSQLQAMLRALRDGATVEGIRVAGGCEVRASLASYRGRDAIHVRTWWRAPGGSWCPTRRGVTVVPEQLERLEAAVRTLREAYAAGSLGAPPASAREGAASGPQDESHRHEHGRTAAR